MANARRDQSGSRLSSSLLSLVEHAIEVDSSAPNHRRVDVLFHSAQRRLHTWRGGAVWNCSLQRAIFSASAHGDPVRSL
jgi:hypothetical protein